MDQSNQTNSTSGSTPVQPTTPAVGTPPVMNTDTPPAMGAVDVAAPPVSPVTPPSSGGSFPIIIALLVVVVIVVSGGLAFYMYQQTKQNTSNKPAQGYVQEDPVTPTVAVTVAPPTENSATVPAELDSQPVPKSAEDIDKEVDLLDSSFNDNAEQNFSDSTLDTVAQ